MNQESKNKGGKPPIDTLQLEIDFLLETPVTHSNLINFAEEAVRIRRKEMFEKYHAILSEHVDYNDIREM